MKPVISRSVYYKLLLMRDDSHMRSISLRKITLRLLLLGLLFFFLIGIAGWVVGVRYIDRFYALQSEHQAMQKELVEMKLQLEQLTNVKNLVENTAAQDVSARNNEVGAEGEQTILSE